MTLRIGTSGWIYKHWRGIFYPERVPQREWLDIYVRRFDTVEVNFSFYRLPTLAAFESWRDRAPAGFVYAVKASRFITHVKRLRDPAPHTALLADRLRGLGDRVGPVLWQLPPDFKRDDERLAIFLDALPHEHRHTIEFRHESWLVPDVFAALARHQVALCIPDSPRLPQTLELTADWTYIRFHGAGVDGNYSDELLALWADRIRGYLDRGIAVWAYFNNDWHGFALANADSLRARLADRIDTRDLRLAG